VIASRKSKKAGVECLKLLQQIGTHRVRRRGGEHSIERVAAVERESIHVGGGGVAVRAGNRDGYRCGGHEEGEEGEDFQGHGELWGL